MHFTCLIFFLLTFIPPNMYSRDFFILHTHTLTHLVMTTGISSLSVLNCKSCTNLLGANCNCSDKSEFCYMGKAYPLADMQYRNVGFPHQTIFVSVKIRNYICLCNHCDTFFGLIDLHKPPPPGIKDAQRQMF